MTHITIVRAFFRLFSIVIGNSYIYLRLQVILIILFAIYTDIIRDFGILFLLNLFQDL